MGFEYLIQEHQFGTEIKTKNYLIFFGNKYSNVQNVEKHYSDFNFCRIHQVHGCRVVKAQNHLPLIQADAHIASQKNLALGIITADCIPLFIIAPNGRYAAIHAGWRGVYLKIVQKTLTQLCPKYLWPHCQIFIGPHIQQDSFAVDEPVKNKLCGTQKSEIFYKSQTNKFYISLLNLLIQDLTKTFYISNGRIWTSKVDTFTHLDYHSYRRNNKEAGRQLSFIAKLNK